MIENMLSLLTNIFKCEARPYTYNGPKSVMSISVPSGTKEIADFAFSGCSELTTIQLPKSVIRIGIGVFITCEKLQSIVVQDGNPRYVAREGVLYDRERNDVMWYRDMTPEAIKFILKNFLSKCDIVKVLEDLTGNYFWSEWPYSIGFSYEDTAERRIAGAMASFREDADDDIDNENVCDGDLVLHADVSKEEFFTMMEEASEGRSGSDFNREKYRELIKYLKDKWVIK